MATAGTTIITSVLLLLLVLFVGLISSTTSGIIFPSNCNSIECPKYDVVDAGEGYEIRRYKKAYWTSTSKIDDISLVSATVTAFLQLFDYIQGKNGYGVTIEMTAPVITQVYPSEGPFCASSFVVSFYLPEVNQPDPPPAEGLHLQRWDVKYAAVGQFSGFVEDYEVGLEAAALEASLQGSSWASAVARGRNGNQTSEDYIVAQYNSPFEIHDRVNEIWMTFDLEDTNSI